MTSPFPQPNQVLCPIMQLLIARAPPHSAMIDSGTSRHPFPQSCHVCPARKSFSLHAALLCVVCTTSFFAAAGHPRPSPYSPGTRVMTQWTRAEGGDDLYYPGKIDRCNGHTCGIHYDDGDTWKGSIHHIRPLLTFMNIGHILRKYITSKIKIFKRIV